MKSSALEKNIYLEFEVCFDFDTVGEMDDFGKFKKFEAVSINDGLSIAEEKIVEYGTDKLDTVSIIIYIKNTSDDSIVTSETMYVYDYATNIFKI